MPSNISAILKIFSSHCATFQTRIFKILAVSFLQKIVMAKNVRRNVRPNALTRSGACKKARILHTDTGDHQQLIARRVEIDPCT